ncbi:MAG: hypothetical protein OEV40_12450 [Acidimicrobiia bacterium]|nr:hypothetical protein [Acidimicrobiia bacterium]
MTLSGWVRPGGAPLPGGGTIKDLGVSTDGLFGQAIFFFTEYQFDGEEDAVRTQIEGLVPGSDYDLSEGAVDTRLYLTHPFFTDAFVGFYSAGSGSTIVDLNTQRPLQD